MPQYFYELKRAGGGVVADERAEEHSDDKAAVAYGERVARELGRNDAQPNSFVVVKTEAQLVLAEIALATMGP